MIKSLCMCMLSASLFLGMPANAATSDTPKVLTFGIVPQQSASRLAKMWGPLLKELGAEAGVTFQFQTTKDIPTFEACLAAGAYDVAYMNPMHYAIFSREENYRAIARQSQKRLKGVIVARIDSNFDEIPDLDGTQVAFPSPGAFGASILTRSTLSENGVAFEPNYVKSHDSVYRAVAAGLFSAGGGVTRTFNSVDPEIRENLRIIHQTDGFTPHAIAAHTQIGGALSERIQSALLRLGQSNPELAEGVGMSGFEAGDDADWDDVRGLSMDRDDTGILHAGDASCPSG